MKRHSALLTQMTLLALAVGSPAGCKDDPMGSVPPVNKGDGTDGGGPTTGAAGSSSGTGADSSSGTADGTTGEHHLNCDEITCMGNGACAVDNAGNAYCSCDHGYVIDDNGDQCIIDRSCVTLRFLEERCRQKFNAEPAVSLFFALDFCAGPAVTQQWVDQLGIEFVILENGEDITNNVESEATIVDKDVESFVTLVIDMSDSIAQSEDLSALVSALRDTVQTLDPAPGDPPVAVSVYAFGRFVEELQPFTKDLSQVDATLASLEADPQAVTDLVGGNGTSLYEAVRVGINRTQRIRDLRAAVTHDGVLSTGTVVLVTDGMDTSNGMLDTGLIDATLNQVISIGISGDVDDADLTAIGRDGSFLAPTPDDWVDAFAEVAQRVDEYPDRAYLLAYCSSATQGTPEVTVTVDGPGIKVDQTTSCDFIADDFGTDAGDVCTAALFANECDTQQCGGLTACGACADNECCTGSQCAAPVNIDTVIGPDGALSCDGVDQFCTAGNQVCVTEMLGPDTCGDPAALGDACPPTCEPGVGWCDMDMCSATHALGEDCNTGAECESLNCQKSNPDNPFETPTCQEPALLYDACDNANTVCETGGYCGGSVCAPQLFAPQPCSSTVQCRSGLCTSPVMSNICVETNACYWPWSDKLPS